MELTPLRKVPPLGFDELVSHNSHPHDWSNRRRHRPAHHSTLHCSLVHSHHGSFGVMVDNVLIDFCCSGIFSGF